MMSTAHGAGLILVPALIPLCAGDASALEMAESGPLTLALAAVGIHTAAMLAVTGMIATGFAVALMPAPVCLEAASGSRLQRRVEGGAWLRLRSRRTHLGVRVN